MQEKATCLNQMRNSSPTSAVSILSPTFLYLKSFITSWFLTHSFQTLFFYYKGFDGLSLTYMSFCIPSVLLYFSKIFHLSSPFSPAFPHLISLWDSHKTGTILVLFEKFTLALRKSTFYTDRAIPTQEVTLANVQIVGYSQSKSKVTLTYFRMAPKMTL